MCAHLHQSFYRQFLHLGYVCCVFDWTVYVWPLWGSDTWINDTNMLYRNLQICWCICTKSCSSEWEAVVSQSAQCVPSAACIKASTQMATIQKWFKANHAWCILCFILRLEICHSLLPRRTSPHSSRSATAFRGFPRGCWGNREGSLSFEAASAGVFIPETKHYKAI